MTMAAQALVEVDAAPVPMEAPATESAAIFQIIERAARDKNVDLDKMERLMAMREREMARIAQTAFNVAMKNAQAEMPQIVRDADNDQTKSKYARYETISEAIQPIITKHGFSLSFDEGETPKPNHVRILCDVMHDAGHIRQYHADIPFDNVGMKGNANKTATHAYGSTKSYGRRYLKLDIFDIALKNEDDDGNAAGRREEPEFLTPDQITELRETIEANGGDIARFCKFGGVGSLAEIRSNQFNAAMQVAKTQVQP
jgi:hypothetical protein